MLGFVLMCSCNFDFLADILTSMFMGHVVPTTVVILPLVGEKSVVEYWGNTSSILHLKMQTASSTQRRNRSSKQCRRYFRWFELFKQCSSLESRYANYASIVSRLQQFKNEHSTFCFNLNRSNWKTLWVCCSVLLWLARSTNICFDALIFDFGRVTYYSTKSINFKVAKVTE